MMDNFYAGLAEILEIAPGEVGPELDLTQLAWDSLAIVSTIALADECFGVMLGGSAPGQCRKVADIEALINKNRG